jgi:YHS domain-containing protein
MRLASLLVVALLASPAFAQSPAELDRMERASVASALSWLARHQELDGHWKSSGAADHGFRELYEPDAAAESDVQATSLALLAFLGDGNSPWAGKYREAARRAWEWLLARQPRNGAGGMVKAPPEDEHGTLNDRRRSERRAHVARLNHLWGSLALLETAASAEFAEGGPSSSRVEAAKRVEAAIPAAVAAVKFITADAAEKPGAFDFLDPRTVSMDELALLAAVAYDCAMLHQRGSVDLAWFEGVVERLREIQRGMTGAVVPYRASDDGTYWLRGSVSTPQSMIAFVYLFEQGSATQMGAAGPGLLAHPPRWNTNYCIGAPSRHPDAGSASDRASLPATLRAVSDPCCDEIANEFGWFWEAMSFRSYAALNAPGWKKWRGSFVPVAFENQRRSGPEAGSWDPAGPHARVFGRETGTAWMAITMESRCGLRMARTHWDDLKPDSRWRSIVENLGKGVPANVECSMCHLGILTNTKFSKFLGGKIRYFCSQEELDEFEMTPSLWHEGAAPESHGEGSEGSHK